VKNIRLSVLLMTFLVFLGFGSHAKAEEESRVVFVNELFWAGTSTSEYDEFIELKNNTDENIDLANWQITCLDSGGTEKLMLAIPSGIIPAGGYFLIANSALKVDADLIDSSVSLNNNKLQIKLYDGTWNDGRKSLDTAGDKNKPLAGSNTTKQSMERLEPPGDGKNKESWKSADASPQSSGKPKIISFLSDSTAIYIDANPKNIIFTAEIADPNGAGDIESVTLDLESIGLGKKEMTRNDNIYSFTAVIDINISAGKKNFRISVTDKKGLVATKDISIDFYELSDDIRINEVFPKPADGAENEFIELYNSGKENINMYGWQLDDMENSGSSPYQISQDYIIPAEGYLTFYKPQSKISLNDSGDTVRLINPLGKEADIIAYGKAKEDYSFSKISNSWEWSTAVTPNRANIITNTNLADEKQVFGILPISEAKNQNNGTRVTVVGYVNSIPGSLSNQYFYIQDNDAGIQIYSHDRLFPELAIGDEIKITGEITHITSGYRIRIEEASDIEILKNDTIILPKTLLTGEVDGKFEGMFIKISGNVIETSGNTFYLDDGSGAIKIYIAGATNIKKPKMAKGIHVEVSGILTVSSNTLRLQPRFQSDLNVQEIIKKEARSPLKIIETAHAEESVGTKNRFETGGSANYNKAKMLKDNSIAGRERLMKTLETVIIVSVILLMFLVGERYVRKIERQEP